VNEGGTNNLVLLTFLDNLAMYWDAPAGSSAIWDQLDTNAVWRPSDHLDVGGIGSAADDQAFMNGDRVFFNDSALNGAQAHTVNVVAGGVQVYSMTVAGEDHYTFNGGKITGTATDSTIDPDDGYVVKLSIESSAGATFNNTLEFPFIEVSGSAIFNKTVTGTSYTDEDNNIIYPNGLLNVYGANGNVRISGDGNFTVGNIILQNAGNTLTFDRAAAAPLTYSGVISGVGPVIKENGGTVTLEGPNSYTGNTHVVGGTLLVKVGLGNSGTTRNYGGDIRIERNAVLEFSPNSPSALPGSGRAQEISGVLHGKFQWDSIANDYARDIHYNLIPQYGDDGVLRATNTDLTISNVRNTFNGDIEVRNSSVRVTGTLGSFSETFDGNTPYVATYWHTNYQGNINLLDSTSSLEFAYAQEYQYLGGTLSGVAGSQVILNSGQPLYVAANTSQFYGHTDVQSGAFHINAASYGAPGTTGNFTVSAGASLHGGRGAVLNVNNLDMAVGSHLGVVPGGFQVNIGETALANVKLATNISIIVDSSASVPVGTYSTHDGGPMHSGPASANGHTASVSFANASGNVFTGTNGVLLPNSVNLRVGISGYIPTEGAKNEYVLMDGLDVLGIVSASGMGTPSAAILSIFGGDGTLKIMGATYLLSFNQNKLIMTQETYAITIPEPSTYALAGGLGVLGFALWRRRKRKLAAMAAK
jgi:autotransporter-associated beta strand protein